MKIKKWQSVGLMSVTLSLLLVGCGNKGGSKTAETTNQTSEATTEMAEDQTFKTVVNQEMPTVDLSLSTDVISAVALNNVYEGLYRVGKDGQVEPAGAAELGEVSEDGLTYKFKLNEKAQWSDEKPVKATDYVYAWQRVVDPKTASEYAYLTECVKNAADITASKKDKSELGIKAVGDYELEITLENPTPYFDYLLSFTTFFPMRQDIVEKYGKDYAATSEKAVYNGPFVLTEFDGPGTDLQWSYEKNETYWDKETVKLSKINVDVVKDSTTALNLYQDNQAEDVLLNGELALQMSTDKDFVTDKLASTMYLEMNQHDENSPFKNKNFRQAISYVIDREAIVTQILGNGSVASTGLVPAGIKAKIDGKEVDFAEKAGNLLELNLDKAKEHWEKAQKELGKKEVTFDLLTADNDAARKVSEYLQGAIQENLKGVKVTVSPVTFAIRLDRGSKNDFEMLNSGWTADYADPSSFTDLFIKGISYNQGKYENAKYDKLVNASSTTHATDPAKRWDDMLQAEKIILEDAGVIPMYQKAEAHLRTQKIKDVVVNSAGAQYDYKWAYKVK